jgi:hypothetical protein
VHHSPAIFNKFLAERSTEVNSGISPFSFAARTLASPARQQAQDGLRTGFALLQLACFGRTSFPGRDITPDNLGTQNVLKWLFLFLIMDRQFNGLKCPFRRRIEDMKSNLLERIVRGSTPALSSKRYTWRSARTA